MWILINKLTLCIKVHFTFWSVFVFQVGQPTAVARKPYEGKVVSTWRAIKVHNLQSKKFLSDTEVKVTHTGFINWKERLKWWSSGRLWSTFRSSDCDTAKTRIKKNLIIVIMVCQTYNEPCEVSFCLLISWIKTFL